MQGSNKDKKDKIYGGIYGLLLGDAIGVSFEFKAAQDIQASDIDIAPQNLKNKTYPEIPFGTWSDDGAQSLILLDSLLVQQSINYNDLLDRLVRWLDHGEMAVDQHTFDVGIQTREYLYQYKVAGEFKIDNHPRESQNGNGSLMRCLPLALWHTGSDQQLVEFAQQQSLVTHPHLRSQVCCALYCLIARNLLLGHQPIFSIEQSKQTLKDIYMQSSNHAALDELNNHVLSYDMNNCQGSGYVVDSLMSSLSCLTEHSYEQVIKKAILLGNDTDTTACIAGGLAGIYFGFNTIPKHWVAGLRGQDILQPLLDQLLQHVCNHKTV